METTPTGMFLVMLAGGLNHILPESWRLGFLSLSVCRLFTVSPKEFCRIRPDGGIMDYEWMFYGE